MASHESDTEGYGDMDWWADEEEEHSDAEIPTPKRRRKSYTNMEKLTVYNTRRKPASTKPGQIWCDQGNG